MLFPTWDDKFDYPAEGDSFIHHPVKVLPIHVRENLARILDSTCKLKVLYGYFKLMYTYTRCGLTPGSYLMMRLCDSDCTITDLFVYLARVKCVRGMLPLKEYVDEKYQILLEESTDLKIFLKKLSLQLEYDYRKNYLPANGAVERGAIRPIDICDYIYSVDTTILMSYRTIEKLTDKFKPSLIVQKGTFNTHYKAEVRGKKLLIKKFHFCQLGHFEINTHQLEMALKDIKYMQIYRHENVLRLWGFGFQADEMCLVYTYALQYSLYYHINMIYPVENPLPFYRRFFICRGIAKGINYLHTHRDLPLIHLNIRPHNILLDIDLTPKIANFSLAREGPLPRDPPMPTDNLYEIIAYYPMEYIFWPHYVSTKLDIYSFGVTVMQLLACQVEDDPDGRHIRNYIHNLINRDRSVEHVIDMRDRPDPTARAIAVRIIYMAYLCTKHNYSLRPEMKSIYTRLRQMF
ncbi:uncharacterized protein LOC129802888 [Phlebotomus papatasi]|uniref:uncharacterized protein LOC129802888 n=1 Tax=Phlebotomus papatasi TaxID=29031 RepID=UPI0024835F1A|nr:uncharacterized protein LOC129802888 [Phlebotomus papatasi]